MRQFQVLANCVHCHVEGAVIETFDEADPCCHLGVAAQSACRMCGRQTQGQTDPPCTQRYGLVEERCPQCGTKLQEEARAHFQCSECGVRAFEVVTQPPRSLQTLEEVERALTAWAQSEGMLLAEFLETSFTEDSVAAIHQKLATGQPVMTSFDILGFLFSHLGGGASVPPTPSQPDAPQTLAPVPAPRVPAPAAPPPPSQAPQPRAETRPPVNRDPLPRAVELPEAPTVNPRNRIMPLVSVMAADGRLLPKERAFIDRILAEESMEPLTQEEIRIHHPQEIGAVGTDEEHDQLLSLMFQLAYIDNEGDLSELNIIRAYAHRWGIAAERIAALDNQYKPMGWDRFLIRLNAILLG